MADILFTPRYETTRGTGFNNKAYCTMRFYVPDGLTEEQQNTYIKEHYHIDVKTYTYKLPNG